MTDARTEQSSAEMNRCARITNLVYHLHKFDKCPLHDALCQLPPDERVGLTTTRKRCRAARDPLARERREDPKAGYV